MTSMSTSFYIPRVCKRWMPHDIQAMITAQMGATCVRVDIVPIVRNGEESFIERLDKEHHSVFVYFDKPVDYSSWSNGLKGGKQTRVYTGCWMTPLPVRTEGFGTSGPSAPDREHSSLGVYGVKPHAEFWVLIPNNPRSVIPYTSKSIDTLEQELITIKENLYKIADLAVFNKELTIWEYDWNCVQFHKQLQANASVEVCQQEFDKIYCAWLSIHQVAANIEHLAQRVNPERTEGSTARETGVSLKVQKSVGGWPSLGSKPVKA